MRIKSIQDVLHLTEQPSRYLGSEVNRIKKDPKSVQLKFLLAFPDLYEIGTSHFGIQILYHLINREPDMLAERVFAPALDMEAQLRGKGLPLTSLESGIPMSHFDIIGFSLLYEMNYTNVLGMLSLAGLPFLSGERRETDPLVIAGGPCTSNPEPVADIFDAVVIGDGEAVVPRLTRAWKDWKQHGEGRKDELLGEWARLEGVYVPKYYEPSYDANGFQTLGRHPGPPDIAPAAIRRGIVPELRTEDFPDRPIIPFGKPIHDRLRIEVARGCTRGCRFCQAGMIYRPVRERSVGQLMSLAETSLAATGYEDLSLLSLSTGDYSDIVPLMQKLMARCEKDRIAVSFPSLRAGTMSPELMTLVKKVRKTGFTMAVEAGSQRLRDVINKNIRREDIFTMVEDAFGLGWQVIKLYFMIGLPGETPEDLEEMVTLVKDIHKIKGPKGRKGKINVSVNTFIPKSHTPFQWAGQLSMAESMARIEGLKQALRIPRIQFKWQNPENSFLEGLWARGDRRLTRLLITAYEKGCRFDGWNDHFRYDRWAEAIGDAGIDADFFVTRNRDLDEPLPWDHIDMRIEKEFLKGEWRKAQAAAVTPDCRDNPCVLCGVCDHKTIRPIFSNHDTGGGPAPKGGKGEPDQEFFKAVTVTYSRTGQARYFGHLELVNILLRAIRRAGIPVAYSQGFHPMPKISFDDPLPLGYESLGEAFRMRVPGNVRPAMVMEKLNPQLPEGLWITDCRMENHRKKGPGGRLEIYTVSLRDGCFDSSRIDKFKTETEVLHRRCSRKGRVSEIDLKKAVQEMALVEPGKLRVVLSLGAGQTLRPGILLAEIFELTEDTIRDARILKTETVYT
jgi:radical SAM family uncharacterized protein/radical SAM-linked protein